MINGINHINIAVSDIERSFLFYKDILGFKPLCKSEGSAYFLAGNPDDPRCLWFSLDLDRSSLRRPSPCNTHFAFSVNDEDFEALCQRITQSGAKVFKDNTSPGKSLYFLDPDDHKLEIHVGDWYVADRNLINLNRVFDIFHQYCTYNGMKISREEFIKNLEQKKDNRDFHVDMSLLLPSKLHWNFEEAYQFVIDNVISRLP